ncbi:sel1 repeat family protein [Mitsuokella sp. AF33-22]|nr:sel1 repeat family protein [Mitsuokella sp. AF33-22]
MHPVCWEKFPYETERDLQDRIEKMPVLPLGLCLPDRNSYDIHTQLLTFAVKPFAYVKEKLTSPSITLKFNRDAARKICTWNRPYRIFGQLKGDKTSFILWDKELGVFYNENPNSIHNYKKAAEKGSLKAQLALGNCYCQGIGVEKDEQEAFHWYLQAANQGNMDAQYWIGYSYDHGRGVKQDYEQAITWYRKAANQGDALSQSNIVKILNEQQRSLIQRINRML